MLYIKLVNPNFQYVYFLVIYNKWQYNIVDRNEDNILCLRRDITHFDGATISADTLQRGAVYNLMQTIIHNN